MGLLEMIYPGVAFPQQHLTELIEQRRCRGSDGTLTYGHAQYGVVTALLNFEAGRIRTQQFQQRNAVDARHLLRIGRQFACSAPPDHNRRHHESGSGGEVVEPAEDGVGAQREPHFLLELPQGTFLGRLARVEATPRQRPLPRMAAHVFGTSGENQRRLATPGIMHGQTFEIGTKALLHHREGHRSMQTFVDQVLTRIEAPETLTEQRA